MLKVESASKQFRAGNFGVRNLSLEVKSGVIGLLGPNGAGKTTRMQMIATITRPTSGRIPSTAIRCMGSDYGNIVPGVVEE